MIVGAVWGIEFRVWWGPEYLFRDHYHFGGQGSLREYIYLRPSTSFSALPFPTQPFTPVLNPISFHSDDQITITITPQPSGRTTLV